MQATNPRSAPEKASFDGPVCPQCGQRAAEQCIRIVRRAATQFLSTVMSLLWFESARNAPRRADLAKLLQDVISQLGEGDGLPATLRLFTLASRLRDDLDKADALEQVVLRATADMLRALAVTPTAEQACEQILGIHGRMLDRTLYAVADRERLQGFSLSRTASLSQIAARLQGMP